MDADQEEDLPPDRPAVPPVVRTPGVFWKPTVGMTWDWQLKVPIDPTVNVEVYDIDMFENDAHVVHDLHMRGKKVICYVNMGAWENWRPDANTVPPHLRGTQYHGFPDENWLDIRDIVGLTPFVHSRLNRARDMGCDAVEPDNMDGYDTMAHEPTGFPLTPIHQIVYNRYVASQAHVRGMAVGLKNNTAQVEAAGRRLRLPRQRTVLRAHGMRQPDALHQRRQAGVRGGVRAADQRVLRGREAAPDQRHQEDGGAGRLARGLSLELGTPRCCCAR